MFTLLRNFRAMFMLTVANKLEGPVDAFDTTDDNQLDAAEAQLLLESAEAKNIVGLAEVDTLESAVDLASNINLTDGLNKFEQQTIQYLATKILKLTGAEVQDGSIDGNIGRGSRSDIALASGIAIPDNTAINGDVIIALTNKANELAVTKRAEFALAASEAEAAAQKAEEIRQSNLQTIAEFDWENRDEASLDEIKDLQKALKALDYPISTIDGIITPGRATEQAYNAVQGEIEAMEYSQAQARLEDAEVAVEGIEGPQDAEPIIAERDEAEEALETIQQDIADEADVYSRLEMSDDPTAQELKDLLLQDPEGKLLLCQLQADMKLLKDSDGNTLYTGAIDGHRGIEYGFGSGTAGAVTKALEIHGSITAIRRAARIAEVTREAEINTGSGRTNEGINIVAQTEGYEAGDLEAFLAEAKCPDNMPEEIKQGTPEEQQAWIIGQAIEMGDRENADKTRLTLIDGLSQAGNDRIIDVMKELRGNFETTAGQAEIIQAMSNGVDLSAEDFENGEVGSQNYQALELGGRIIDAGLLDSAYIATGSDQIRDHDGARMRGTMEVPIWNADGSINEKFAELDFSNATYINGAIVMTVQNGCEGNLVIIPVQREKYVPPVVPPRVPRASGTPARPRSTPAVPGTPPVVIVPGETPRTGVRRECDNNGNWVATTWEETGNTIIFGLINTTTDTGSTILIPNASQCNGGDNDPTPAGEVSTSPGDTDTNAGDNTAGEEGEGDD